MAKRILSAESALVTRAQTSLADSVRTESRRDFLANLQHRWEKTLSLQSREILFDWEDQATLRAEMTFINETQSKLDEAATRIAPSLLRIVLTVKSNIIDPKAQRAYLAEHLSLDFRRISELCIVADSYALLDPEFRQSGEREIAKYGWSKALKLAYVREERERLEIWERACAGNPTASYRAVLEEIRHFRERKLIAPPAQQGEIDTRMGAAREMFTNLSEAADKLNTREDYQQALQSLESVRKELGGLKKILRDRMEILDIEALAALA